MNNQGKLNAVCYGEVLWDVFANDKKIGGAPLNVALRMQALGCNAAMISCVGNDQDGKDIIAYVNNQGLDAGAITVNDNYPTGLVQVFLNERGSASYDIKYPSRGIRYSLTTMPAALWLMQMCLYMAALYAGIRYLKNRLKNWPPLQIRSYT